MKTVLIILGLLLELYAGVHIGELRARDASRHRIDYLESRLERFENKEVFEHAQKVSRITGTDLYQVLTGNN